MTGRYIDRYQVGQRISHPTYGAGTVLEIVGNAVRVEFDEHGVHYMIPKPSEAEDADPIENIKNYSAHFMKDVLSGQSAAEEFFEAFFGQPISGAAPEITSSRKRFSTQPEGQGRPKGYAPWKPQKKTRVLMSQVKEILVAYEAELPLTARQIFYRLVGAYGYPKTESAYESLTNHLVRARRAGVIRFEDIRDDGAAVMEEKHYTGEEAFYAEVRKMG